jgi:hypothetical protein
MRMRFRPPAQPRHDARQPGVGGQHVRSEAQELKRQVLAGDAAQQADQGALRGYFHETLGRAADPEGGEARQRLSRLDHQAGDLRQKAIHFVRSASQSHPIPSFHPRKAVDSSLSRPPATG